MARIQKEKKTKDNSFWAITYNIIKTKENSQIRLEVQNSENCIVRWQE